MTTLMLDLRDEMVENLRTYVAVTGLSGLAWLVAYVAIHVLAAV